MKESTRRGVFETNSSSTHSLTMCTEQEFEDWKNGKTLINRYDGEFIPAEKNTLPEKDLKIEYFKEYAEKIENGYVYENKYYTTLEDMVEEVQLDEKELEAFKNDMKNDDYMTYDEFWNYYEDEYNTFTESYTTKSGEKIVAFGYYGYDG